MRAMVGQSSTAPSARASSWYRSACTQSAAHSSQKSSPFSSQAAHGRPFVGTPGEGAVEGLGQQSGLCVHRRQVLLQ